MVLTLAWSVQATSKNPDTFVLADFGSVESLDPARCYDTAGAARLLNIYDTLVAFDGSRTDKFIPLIATEVPLLENGGISKDGLAYSFKIRKGVKFHEGGELTPEDVVYSLKRAMITDPNGGPMWMLLEALTGDGATRDDKGQIIPGVFDKIDKSIESKADRVILHLPKPYPPLLGILAYNSHVIINKKWAIANGCWDGNIQNAAKYNNPPTGKEPLQKIANGTGPYKLKLFEPSNETVFERFEGYWGPKPKIKTAIIKYVAEWSTRKLMLQNGDADRASVNLPFVNEVKAMKDVVVKEAPQLAVVGACFTQKIDPVGNPNIGSGKLDGEGIPPDFFSDINVRKAFLHAYDGATFKKQVLNNLGELIATPHVIGLPYYKSNIPIYEFDLKKSAEYMKKAWNGEVWNKGFKMVLTFNTGREDREAAAHMLAENITSLNPKFKIEVRNIEWRDYMVQVRSYRIPIFIIGWGADYADPHNFMYAYMSSNGTYGKFMGYNNPEVDKLLTDGIQTVDPRKRDKIYEKLQKIWHDDALGIALYQSVELFAYRNDVHGYVLNPIYSSAYEFFYRLAKD
jgi:peptide/nickel transport system substrate-binding protein